MVLHLRIYRLLNGDSRNISCYTELLSEIVNPMTAATHHTSGLVRTGSSYTPPTHEADFAASRDRAVNALTEYEPRNIASHVVTHWGEIDPIRCLTALNRNHSVSVIPKN